MIEINKVYNEDCLIGMQKKRIKDMNNNQKNGYSDKI